MKKVMTHKINIIFFLAFAICLSSCSSLTKRTFKNEDIKIVGNAYLYDFCAWPPEEMSDAYTWNSNKELISINISHTRINTEQLTLISKSKSLKKAILRHTDIEDSQVAYLENAVNLERLSLASTNITNESLQYLEQLKYLTWLDLSKTNITKEAKDKLQKVLPNTKIDFFK